MKISVKLKMGWSLMELLCVIAILLSLYIGVIAKAFLRVKHMFEN